MKDLSLSPSAWNTRPTEGSSSGPSRIASPWSLTIPKSPKKVGYVENPNESLKDFTKIRIEFEITGSGVLTASDGGSPARIALFFSAPNDNGQCGEQSSPTDPAQYKYRWWSATRMPLVVPMPLTVFEVALTPDQWISCWGRNGNLNSASRAGFSAAKASAGGLVGFTFGASSAGHGISTTGSIQFKLKKYSLI